MNKFWIATDKEGYCYAFKSKPFRTTINTWDINKTGIIEVNEEMCRFLIGKVLTWKDEPVEVTINF